MVIKEFANWYLSGIHKNLFIWQYFMNPSFTVNKYQLRHCIITFSKALYPPQVSAFFVCGCSSWSSGALWAFQGWCFWWTKFKTSSLDSFPGSIRVWESWTITPSTQAQKSRSAWQTLRTKTKKGYRSFIRSSRLRLQTYIHFIYHPHRRTDNLSSFIISIFWFNWLNQELNQYNMGREDATYWKGAAALGGIS